MPRKRTTVTRVCVQCAAEFPARTERPNARFCSRACSQKWQSDFYADQHVYMSEQWLAKTFWSRVNKDGPIPEHMPHLGPCWVWTGQCIQRQGFHSYGLILRRRQKLLAHRVAWEVAHDEHPGKGFVCHHCDNPRCVNPDHLFLGDVRLNSRDMVSKGRSAKPHAILTQAIADEIRARYETGEFYQRELAAEYGIALPTISDVLRGRSWVTHG